MTPARGMPGLTRLQTRARIRNHVDHDRRRKDEHDYAKRPSLADSEDAAAICFTALLTLAAGMLTGYSIVALIAEAIRL